MTPAHQEHGAGSKLEASEPAALIYININVVPLLLC
jgi:hypothetical protein